MGSGGRREGERRCSGSLGGRKREEVRLRGVAQGQSGSAWEVTWWELSYHQLSARDWLTRSSLPHPELRLVFFIYLLDISPELPQLKIYP